MKRFLITLAVLIGAGCPGAEILPVPMTAGANSSRFDAADGDGKGGWTDQGANDMRLLPAGRRDYAGVPFEVADWQGNEKNCVVVSGNIANRDYLPRTAEISIEPRQGENIYLLHTSAWTPDKGNVVGRLTALYSDGSKQEWRVRSGREVSDWWSANYKLGNGAIGDMLYNKNSTVAIYVSKFQMEPGKKLTGLRFAADTGIWMVVGVSTGDTVKMVSSFKEPKAISPKLNGEYTFPEAPDAAALAAIPRAGKPKNIVLIIGDGMGQGSLKYGSLYACGREGGLVMDQFPVKGMALTYSANSTVTDSAASGTALSSGYKTNNGYVGCDGDKKPMRSIAEEARDIGKAVGVMTTDELTGATPTAFYAHVPDRGRYDELATYSVSCDFDLLIGGDKSFSAASRGDQRDLTGELKSKGYRQVAKPGELAGVGEKVFGFPAYNAPVMADWTAAALERLAQDPDGFFAMIEVSWPDGGGHGNSPDGTVKGVSGTDYAVKAALDFARKNGETLIVVTADHETGGIFCTPNTADPKQPTILYTSTGHTHAPVNVYAFGPGADKFGGMIENTDIPARFAEFWGLRLGKPYAVSGQE